MTYSEKLKALTVLTATKGTDLATALNLQPAYVSRMKNGSRKLPKNTELIRKLAEYFAPRCNGELNIKALRKYTAQPNCTPPLSNEELAGIIFRWLSQDDSVAELKSEEGRYIGKYEFVAQGEKNNAVKAPPQEGSSLYRHNSGKRQAVKSMFSYLLTLSQPCIVRVFSDEAYDWITEDADYSNWINDAIAQLTKRGFTFERIQQPHDDAEMNLSLIERWLGAYGQGAITQYYYPNARDKLHRKTLFVVPRQIALTADSTYGQRESIVTVLTRDPYLVDLYDKAFDAILQKCRLAINIITAEQTERIISEMEKVDALKDVGLTKSRNLPIHTLPRKLIERIGAQSGSLPRVMAESYARCCQANKQMLTEYSIIDVCTLPNLADVIAGKEPMAGTLLLNNPLYYTLQEYEAHLESILWRLEVYPNYWVIFSSVKSNGSVYVKGNSRVLLTRMNQPYALYDVAENTLASAFYDYFLHIAESKLTAASREQSIKRIKDELRLIESAK